MTLSLDSNKAAPKLTLNTSKLKQGLSINLSKSNPSLERVAVKVNWIGDDLDINAVCLDAQGKALLEPVEIKYQGRNEVVPKDLIFYMNLEQKGIKHGGDLVSTGGLETEAINVASKDLNDNVKGIDFVVTSHVEKGSALMFKDVKSMQVELVDLDTNEVLYSTDLDTSNIANQSTASFASFAMTGEGLTYTTDTKGLGSEAHGVQNILNNYYG